MKKIEKLTKFMKFIKKIQKLTKFMKFMKNYNILIQIKIF